MELLDGDLPLGSVPVFDHSCLGRQLQEPLQGIGGPAFGHGFQHFADGDQGHDHGRGFKVEAVHVRHHGFSVPRQLVAGHLEQDQGAPDKGGHGTHGHQGIHIGGQMQQALKAAGKKSAVDHHDDPCQDHLRQPHGNVVSLKECRQRPAPHHMSHGAVHQNQKDADGRDQAPAQHRCFPVLQRVLLFFHPGPCPGCRVIRISSLCTICTAGDRRPVARVFHSRNHGRGVRGPLHAHGIGQQAHGHGRDARYASHCFFDPRLTCRAAHSRYIVFLQTHDLFLSVLRRKGWPVLNSISLTPFNGIQFSFLCQPPADLFSADAGR